MNLAGLKVETLSVARSKGLGVAFRGTEVVVVLVPVGPWVLLNPELVRAMSEWRARSMQSFHIRFESTPSKTEQYLRDFSLGRNDRLLFMIEVNGDFLGHIGLANVTADDAEIDNVMRGIRGGPPGLMEVSARTLIEWAFRGLGLHQLYLQVLSDNQRAKDLYGRLGFETTERYPLRVEKRADSTALVRCSGNEATENFTSDVMSLDRESFERARRS